MTKTEENQFNIKIDEMIQAGLHFGHKTSRIHPKMKPYLDSVKSNIHIINLEKTAKKLEEALKFIQKIISENKILLLIGTKIQARDLVKNYAQELSLPFINERWVGGTFTNFEIIKKRLIYFKDLERKKKEEGLEKYTKKEIAKIDKELRNLKIKFGGIKDMEKLPDAIFVLDIKKDDLAIKEARMKGIKIIGVVDTNANPTLVDFPIPANDDTILAIKYILEKMKEVIQGAKNKP
jgi:small subunit ribosomal protein S2